MALFLYGTDPNTRKLSVKGPFKSETQRQRAAGDLLNEGTVTLKTQKRDIAESTIKVMMNEGRLGEGGTGSTRRELVPHYTGTKKSGSGFFSTARAFVKKFTDQDEEKEKDPWK